LGKRELRKLKSNLGKIDELYGERKALKEKLATAKKDIKKFTFTGPSEEEIQSLSEEIESTEQEIMPLEHRVSRLEKRASGEFHFEYALPVLIFLVGAVAIFLSPDPESIEDQSNEQGIDELVTDESDFLFDTFCFSWCCLGPISIILVHSLVERKPAKLMDQKSNLDHKKYALKKLKSDLKNAKSAESAYINAPKLAEELVELDAEIEELYSEVKHLIPFSDILEN
jgi:hypothetical protein